MLYFILPGEPIAKARPRSCRNGFFYDPQTKTKNETRKQILDLSYTQSHKTPFPSHIPIEIHMTFYCSFPKMKDKRSRNLFLWGCKENISKPDDDNLEKFYKDCLSKIVYEDDKQINYTTLKKLYSVNPRTEIIIMPKQKTISDKAEDVLSMIHPQEFLNIADEVLYLAECIEDDNSFYLDPQIKLQAVFTISRLADEYSNLLSKIAKKYPGLWKEIVDEYSDNTINQQEKFKKNDVTTSACF